MISTELQSMTVLQLRKLAKDHQIKLSAGIDKAGIIDRLTEELNDSLKASESSVFSAEHPDSSDFTDFSSGISDKPAARRIDETDDDKAAAPAGPRFNSRPAYQAPASSSAHGSWQSTSPTGRQLNAEQRVQPMRPGTSTPRFGPGTASVSHVSSAHPQSVHGPVVTDTAARTVLSPLPEHRFGPDAGISVHATPSFSAGFAAPVHSSLETSSPVYQPDDAGATPTLEELLASGDFEEGEGILELHPDGYGFLRASHFLPSSKDVYVSMAQIRRFGLRTGDLVKGKIRPQREGDKYAAMLFISSVNDQTEEETLNRPIFDELTPTYPTRRISLESVKNGNLSDMRLVDLIAPLGFGQRALMLCPPNTGKTEMLKDFANILNENYPEAETLMLLIDVNPEDVTMMRDQVHCPVLASTFDQAPESHLRLSEMVLERAMRLVELKKDVFLIVDSLTRLAKIYTTAAAQQGRSLPGMVNPSSLFRAKRLFGAARSCKEGGSLTVIAAMDVSTGSKVDDSVVEEFKGTANMELALDASVARAGVFPAINLLHSYTKNADILLDDRQKEGLSLIRQLLGNTSSAVAIPQLESMMEKASTNEDLLLKMKDWFALMNR